MPLLVRPATPLDALLMAEWARAMALETEGKELDGPTVSAGIRAGVADPQKARYFLATIDDVPAGMLMLTVEWSDWRNGEWWWIQSVYVTPSHRRRGVYKALHGHVDALGRGTAGVVGLRLYVERSNVNAQKTYAALGMTDAGYAIFEATFATRS